MGFWHRKNKEESYLEKRERISLTEAILEELKRQENLRNDVLGNLGIRTRFGRFTRHPAFLVFLSFLVTGVIGTGLSIYWQGKLWTQQQDLLAEQRSLEQKYQVTNDTAKAMGEIHASMMSVLGALNFDDDKTCLDEMRKVLPDWKKAKVDWRVKSSILLSQLTVNFPTERGNNANRDIPTKFQGISRCYQCLNVALTNMAEAIDANRGKRDEIISNDIRKLTETLRKTNDEVGTQLMSLMAERLHPPQPDAFRSRTPANQSQTSKLEDDPCHFQVQRYATASVLPETSNKPRFCSSQ